MPIPTSDADFWSHVGPEEWTRTGIWLIWGVIYAFGLTIVRLLLNKFVLEPLGARLIPGVEAGLRQRPKPNETLQKVLDSYKDKHMIPVSEVRQLAQSTNLSESDVSTWMRCARKAIAAERKISKFTASLFQLFFYSLSTVYGIFVLQQKEFMMDPKLFWEPFPNPYDAEVAQYYQFALVFYLHMVAAQFYEVRKKDFWEMFIHHVSTLLLVIVSWLVSFTRVGAAVLLVHDVADPLLHLGKFFIYIGRPAVAEFLFVFFVIVFGVSRLYVYPVHIIWTTHIYTKPMHGAIYTYSMFMVLLCSLLLLHIFWFSIIMKMAFGMLCVKDFKDARSESDGSGADDGDKRKRK